MHNGSKTVSIVLESYILKILMPHIKGFIFDLDGVIVDTAKYHFEAWQRIARSLGADFDHKDNEQLKGVSRVRSLELILNWHNIEVSKEDFIRLLDQKNKDYLALITDMDASEQLPDVSRVLAFLKGHHQKVAVGSASKNARPILEKIQLLNQFDAVVDGTNVTKAKPDPEVFLQAAEQIGVGADHCVVFEDAQAGIQAAKAAGMIAIGIGSADVLKEADHVFANFTEIDNAFLNQIINTK